MKRYVWCTIEVIIRIILYIVALIAVFIGLGGIFALRSASAQSVTIVTPRNNQHFPFGESATFSVNLMAAPNVDRVCYLVWMVHRDVNSAMSFWADCSHIGPHYAISGFVLVTRTSYHVQAYAREANGNVLAESDGVSFDVTLPRQGTVAVPGPAVTLLSVRQYTKLSWRQKLAWRNRVNAIVLDDDSGGLRLDFFHAPRLCFLPAPQDAIPCKIGLYTAWSGWQ